MSKKDKREAKKKEMEIKRSEDAKQEVMMVFHEDKFYNDLNKAHFEKGVKYKISGADQIQRWLKRGGEIVEGELKIEIPEHNPSTVVQNPAASVDPVVDSEPLDEKVESPESSEDKSEDQESDKE